MPAAATPTRLIGFAVLVLAALTVSSLFVGVGTMSGSPDAWFLFVASRLPRTLAVLLAGSGLAVAGLVMQAMARNRFVEPATAGTLQGAALGGLIAVLLAPDASIFLKAAIASVSALASTSGFLALASRIPPQQPFLLPLVGLIYGGIIGAAVTFIAWQTDLMQLVEIFVTGEFSGIIRGRFELLWITAFCVAAAWWIADRLTIVSLGRDVSISMGLNYSAVLRAGLVIVSVISALTVVIVGMIAFVGLVVPAIVSRIAGDNVRATIPLVALTGAILVLTCDIIGRVIRYPYEIPAGTICSVVGAIAFLAILRGRLSHV